MTAKDGVKRPSGPGRLSAELAADLPARLLDAAESLFSENGFAGTSMEGIARKAGASTKTIYSRYGDKAEMLQAVIKRLIDRTVEAHKAEVAIDPRKVEPYRFLVSLGRQIVLTVNTRGAGLNRLALAEANQHPALAELYKIVIAHGTALLRDVFIPWRAAGLFSNMPDVEKASALCLSMLTDHARIRSALGMAMSEEEIEAHLGYAVDVFMRGCGYMPKPQR